MAENIIKDFVKKQTTPITIGKPKQRPQDETQSESRIETEEIKPTKHVGRPKSEIEKVKISVYVPAEAKEKLIRIQHDNYRQNLNDVLMEAVNDLIAKYGR